MSDGGFTRTVDGTAPEGRAGVPPRLFVPCGDLVAVHMFKQGRSEGGILIPDTASAGWEACKGILIAIGPRVPQDAGLKEGDRILCFPNTMCRKMRLMGWDYLLLSWSELAAVEDTKATAREARSQEGGRREEPGKVLEELAREADGGDEDAQNTLVEMARQAGVDSDVASTWAEVVEKIKSKDP